MPDWIAHMFLGFTIATALRMKPKQKVVFLIGNIMPDLVRFLVIIANLVDTALLRDFIAYPINLASHSLIGVVVFSLAGSLFFERSLLHENGANTKPKQLLNSPMFLLFIGGILHLFLDTFMWPWAGGVMWLYPIDHAAAQWSFKLLWPSEFGAMVVLSIPFVIAVAYESIIWMKATSKKNGEDKRYLNVEK